MSNVEKNRDWSDVVADTLREAEAPLDSALWGRIEGSIHSSTPMFGRARIWTMVSGAVAAVIIALLFVSPEDGGVVESPMQPISQISQVDHEEIPIMPIIPIIPIESEEQESENMLAICEMREYIPTTEESVLEDEIEHSAESQQHTQPNSTSDYHHYYQEVDMPKIKRQTNLAVLYSGGVSSNTTSGSSMSRYMVVHSALPTADSEQARFDDLYNSSDISHHQPFGVGLRVQRELSQRLLVGSGLTYTRLVSDVDMSSSDDATKQQIHFVGVPLFLKYRFLTANHFSLYAGAGGGVEYCVGAKVGSRTIDERDWHYSADLNLGAEYSINEWLGLYFEPGLSHYFTKTSLQSIRNDSPTTFTIRLGLSFTL